MNDNDKTKEQLIKELAELRREHAALVNKTSGEGRISAENTVHLSVERYRAIVENQLETLRASEDRYRSVFDNSLYGVFLTVPDGTILDANPAGCRMFGMTMEEICRAGRNGLLDLTDPRLPVLLKERDLNGRTTGELTFIRKDGTRFPGEVSSAIFRDKDGNVRSSMIIRDISQRRNVEKEREQYFNLFQNSSDLMVIADPNGAFIKVNPSCIQTLGYSADELVAKPFIDFVYPEDRQHTIDEMARQLKRGYSLNFENRYVCKDDSIRWLSWRAYVNESEALTYATARDITELKHAEAAMSEASAQANRFSDALDHISAFIYMKDRQRRYVYANRPTLELFKCSAEELRGSDDSRFFPPDTVAQLHAVDTRVLEYGEDTAEEIVARFADGTRRIYWEIKTPIYEDAGKDLIWGLCGISTDITDRKEADAEHERLISELKEALANVKTLSGMLPICASCKKIRDDKGYWEEVASYISKHSEVLFSHGICPDCEKKAYQAFEEYKKKLPH